MTEETQEYDASIEQDIFDTPSNNEEAKSEQKKLLIPVGWYQTETPTLFTPERPEKDKERRVGRFFATLLDPRNGEIVGKLGFRVSPDLRVKEETGKADWSYQMYLRARKAFIEATGVEPSKDSDVMRYLAEYPVAVRVIQTEDGENMVVAFRAVRDGR